MKYLARWFVDITTKALNYSAMNVQANRRFFDSLRILVRAGAGGNGLPKYGGIGGKGGDVYVEGVKGMLLHKFISHCWSH